MITVKNQKMCQLSDIHNNYSFALNVIDLMSYEDVAKSEEWQEGMAEEMNSI